MQEGANSMKIPPLWHQNCWINFLNHLVFVPISMLCRKKIADAWTFSDYIVHTLIRQGVGCICALNDLKPFAFRIIFGSLVEYQHGVDRTVETWLSSDSVSKIKKKFAAQGKWKVVFFFIEFQSDIVQLTTAN